MLGSIRAGHVRSMVAAGLAGWCVANGAWAQTDLSAGQTSWRLTGLIDAGHASLTDADNKAALGHGSGNRWSGWANGGLTSSRLGAIGEWALTDERRIRSQLETQFYPSTLDFGATSGKGSDRFNATIPEGQMLLSREAWVGLVDRTWGSVVIGRSTTISYEQAGLIDPMSVGPGLANVGAIGSFSPYNLSRANNQVKYYTAPTNAWRAGAAFSALGATGNWHDGSTREAFVGYHDQASDLVATYQGTTTFRYAEYGLVGGTVHPDSWLAPYYGVGTGTTSNNAGPTVSGAPGISAWQFAARRREGAFAFTAGYDLRNDRSNAAVNGKSPISVVYAGVGYDPAAGRHFALAYYVGHNATVANNLSGRAQMVSGQYVHTLAPRFDVYAIVAFVRNGSGTTITAVDNANVYVPSSANTGATPAYGERQTAVMVGFRYQFEHALN